jgi:hypothetical protein
MVETAANLIENVLPCVPVRQFVISFPKRIRHYLSTNSIEQKVLDIVVKEIKNKLIVCSPEVDDPQIGAVSYIQHFGNTLNYHPHFHLLFVDGVFSSEQNYLLFNQAVITKEDIDEVQESIRIQVLKYFGKKGYFDEDTINKMLTNENSGFSLDASVCIQSWDRDGLERLIRYCARPSFASESLRWNGPWLIYRLPKQSHTGKRFIQLEPLDFLEKISYFIPSPRKHKRHYHGALAPNSTLRKKVAACAQKRPETSVPVDLQSSVNKLKKVTFSWAKLIARIYMDNPLTCRCGGKMKIRAFVIDPFEIQKILNFMGLPFDIPEFDPAREISNWDVCQLLPTEDGFPNDETDFQESIGEDPPFEEYFDPPHQDYIDPPYEAF